MLTPGEQSAPRCLLARLVWRSSFCVGLPPHVPSPIFWKYSRFCWKLLGRWGLCSSCEVCCCQKEEAGLPVTLPLSQQTPWIPGTGAQWHLFCVFPHLQPCVSCPHSPRPCCPPPGPAFCLCPPLTHRQVPTDSSSRSGSSWGAGGFLGLGEMTGVGVEEAAPRAWAWRCCVCCSRDRLMAWAVIC